MVSNSENVSNTASPPRPRQFTIRGLMLVTLGLALLLSVYRNRPGSFYFLFAGFGIVYLLIILWGGIVCLVALFRKLLRRL